MAELRISLSDESIEKIVDILEKRVKKDSIPIFIYSTENKTAIPPSCRYCSNHPSNGGSGICWCVMGIQTTT